MLLGLEYTAEKLLNANLIFKNAKNITVLRLFPTKKNVEHWLGASYKITILSICRKYPK